MALIKTPPTDRWWQYVPKVGLAAIVLFWVLSVAPVWNTAGISNGLRGAVSASNAVPSFWVATADGAVYTWGAPVAPPIASHLNQPIVGIASTPSGGGYWLVAADGGVFAFGNAAFFGSTGNIHLNQPIVGISSTGTGNGYWLDGSDAGIFTFGDAGFFGASPAHQGLVVGPVLPTPDAMGYWLAYPQFGCQAFGDAAPCVGPGGPPPPGQSLHPPAVGSTLVGRQ